MKLKVDPKLPYHYIIGVGVKPSHDFKPGELFLKYGPVRFTNKDVGKVQDAKILSEDKLFKTSRADAIKIHGCTDLIYSISTMKISASVNQCTLHHFSSEFPIDDEEFETIVNVANFSDSSRDFLRNSRISGG